MGFLDFLSGKPTLDKLARDLLSIARKEGSVGWEYDAAERTLRNASGATLSLTNIFLEYSQAASSIRAALLEKYSQMMLGLEREIPALWTLARESIYPVIRSRHDILSLEIDLRDTDKEKPKSRAGVPFHGDLIIRIGYDFGPSVAQVNSAEVETWGIPIEEVYARALQNLRALEKPQWIERAPGLWQIASDVSYEESMMLLDDVLDRLQVRGDVLLLASNRGILLAAGSLDPAGVDAMLDAARDALMNNPWPLPPQLLRRTARGLEPATLEGPARIKLEALHTIDLATLYADQKNALDKWLERTGRDIFVASYQMTARDDEPDAIESCCAWTEGAHSWLPRTHLIALNRQAGNGKFDTIFVPWKEVEAICAARLSRLEENPPRFEVKDFPDAEEWRRLAAAARS